MSDQDNQSQAVDTSKGKDAVFDFNTCTLEEFDAEITNGKNYRARDEWLTAEEGGGKFARINQMLEDRASGKVAEPAKSAEDKEVISEDGVDVDGKKTETEADGGGGVEDDTVEVNGLKVSKELLYSFIKGRTPEEAVLEALKAERRGQEFIDDLKPRHDQLQETTISLRQELIDVRRELEEQKKVVPAVPVVEPPKIEEVDFDEDAIDLLDPDDVESLRAAFKAQKEAIANPPKAVASTAPTEKKEPEAETGSKETVTPEIKNQLEELEKASIEREFTEIDDLVRSVPELKPAVSFRKLDEDVGNFQIAVGNQSGGGNALQTVRTYFSETPQGEQLRAVCDARGIKPPAEYDKWSDIIKIRKIRNENIQNKRLELAKQFHKKIDDVDVYDVKVEYNSYLDIYKRANPVDIDQLQLKAKISGQKEAARVVAASHNHVPEPNGSVGSPPASPAVQASEQEIMTLISKYQNNPDTINSDEAKSLITMAESIGETPTTDLIKKAKG